jgi:hypothetical protein
MLRDHACRVRAFRPEIAQQFGWVRRELRALLSDEFLD